MRYLITTNEQPPFFTNWFEVENNFCEGVGMVVYDLHKHKFTIDGETWIYINVDNL